MHNNGALWKLENWNTGNNSLAIGVCVVTNQHSFMIAKRDTTSSLWGSNISITGITSNEGNYGKAKLDYDGYANTQQILLIERDKRNCAAYVCSNYILRDYPILYGYLGSAGEWWLIHLNINEINRALELIGGVRITIGDYWTSTQWHQYSAWACKVGGVGVWGTPKSNRYSNRALAKLPEEWYFR